MLGKALAAKSLAAFAVGTLTLGGGVALADSTGVAPSGLGSAINNVVPFPGNGHHYGTIKHHGHPGADNSTNQTGQDNANKPDDPSNGADAHGQAVSGIAKSASPGPGHGAAVSKVARDRHGQGQPDVETSKGPGQNDATEHQNDAPDAQESEAPEPSETEPSETDAPETEAPGISSGRPAVPGAGHSHG